MSYNQLGGTSCMADLVVRQINTTVKQGGSRLRLSGCESLPLYRHLLA